VRRPDLEPDCSRCAALCCVATSFAASEDFAIDKAAGERCVHLGRDHRCTIHAELSSRGFPGCVAYECHGAGPRVTRDFAAEGGERNQAFMVLRVVHELLWYLTEAVKLCPASELELHAALTNQVAELDAIDIQPGAAVRSVDLDQQNKVSRALLLRVGEALGGPNARRKIRSLTVL
jgi:hypothetical protein